MSTSDVHLQKVPANLLKRLEMELNGTAEFNTMRDVDFLAVYEALSDPCLKKYFDRETIARHLRQRGLVSY
jgi:hypothetical protein